VDPSVVPVGLDAGAVTASAKQMVSLVYGGDGTYAPAASSYLAYPLFDPGQTIAVDGAGKQGDPPAFHLAFSAPGRISLSSPTGSPIVLDRTQDSTFAWTATFGDVVVVNLGSGSAAQVQCEWPMAEGQGVVPSSILSGLPAGTVSGNFWSWSSAVQDRTRWQIVAGAGVLGLLTATLQ
jgi:hypothetical protein